MPRLQEEKRLYPTEPTETPSNCRGLGARARRMQMRRKTHIFNSEVINHQNKLPRGGEDLPSLDIFKSRLDGFSG